MRRVVLALFLTAATAQAATVILPVYTAEGATTEIVKVNETNQEIALADALVCSPCAQTLKPGEIKRLPVTSPKPAFVIPVEVESGMTIYSEITTGAGAVLRVPPLELVDVAEFYDLAKAGPYNGGLFVASRDGTTITVLGGEVKGLARGEGAIMPVPASGRATVVSQLGTRFYCFGFLNNWKTGSLVLVSTE